MTPLSDGVVYYEKFVIPQLRAERDDLRKKLDTTIAFAKDRMTKTCCDWEYGSLEEVVKLLGGEVE